LSSEYKVKSSGFPHSFRIKVDGVLSTVHSLPDQSHRDDTEQYINFSDLISAHRSIVKSGQPNFQGCKIPLNTPFNIDLWRELLSDYQDKVIVEFLLYGFPVGYAKDSLPISQVKNHKGAVEFSKEVDAYLTNEISKGVIAGPFSSNPLCLPLTISPLNSVPKKNKSDRRVISDLSFPHGSAVNDGIPKGYYLDEEVVLSFPSVDALASRLQAVGPSALMFKKDLQRAYRQFRTDPGDTHLLGYFWQGDLYLDLALAMGIRSAAHLCQRVTSAVKFIYSKAGYILHNYIDDLAVCCGREEADSAFNILEDLLLKLGIQEAFEKSYGPASSMEFLGVHFDAPSMTMSVTPDRVKEILGLLDVWLHKSKGTKRELQALIGKLQFIAKCIRSGRIFISRLLDVLPSLRRQHHRFHINKEFKRDIMWWRNFLVVLTGCLLSPTWIGCLQTHTSLQMRPCKLVGAGAAISISLEDSQILSSNLTLILTVWNLSQSWSPLKFGPLICIIAEYLFIVIMKPR
jgi:hypothetical protein